VSEQKNQTTVQTISYLQLEEQLNNIEARTARVLKEVQPATNKFLAADVFAVESV
jgi:hypothetical protein